MNIQLSRSEVSVVDDCDSDLDQFVWFCDVHGETRYAGRNGIKKIYLHRVVLERILGRELIKGEQVDHIDGDGLNNTRNNIRLANNSQNNINKGKSSIVSSSVYKGVSWRSGCKKWRAYIKVDGQQIHIGYFYNQIDAAQAYDKAAKEYFGEFAKLNFPNET